MSDEMLLSEPFAVQEVYCDGVEHTVVDGIMTATAYRIIAPCRCNGTPQRVVVGRWVLKVENAQAAMCDARHAISVPFTSRQEDRIGRH